MSRRTWLIAIVAALVVIVLGVVLILTRWAPESNHTGPTASAPMPQPSHPTAGATPTVELKPGPHSPLADVDLPADAVPAGNSSDEERWHYSGPYDDTVAFLRKQFATGPKHDTNGATWWRDLPPCYNDKFDENTAAPRHQSPPEGWVMNDSTLWLWTDDRVSLSVEVFRPSSTTTPNEIVIDYTRWDHSQVCNRA